MHPVSFIIKHCVSTWDLMHNKVGSIYNKHTQPFDHMAHSTTVKAQKPRRKKLKSTTSGRQHKKAAGTLPVGHQAALRTEQNSGARGR